jgi:hypothetical protein
MEALDRNIQREILTMLRNAYPDRVDSRSITSYSIEIVAKNMAYLEEHGLVEAAWPGKRPSAVQPCFAKLTARGLDFLADDGGLSAVLGVVVVQLHEDTLKKLLIDQVDAANESEPVKTKLKEQIRALTAEGIKTVVVESVKASIAQIPNLATFLQSVLGS